MSSPLYLSSTSLSSSSKSSLSLLMVSSKHGRHRRRGHHHGHVDPCRDEKFDETDRKCECDGNDDGAAMIVMSAGSVRGDAYNTTDVDVDVDVDVDMDGDVDVNTDGNNDTNGAGLTPDRADSDVSSSSSSSSSCTSLSFHPSMADSSALLSSGGASAAAGLGRSGVKTERFASDRAGARGGHVLVDECAKTTATTATTTTTTTSMSNVCSEGGDTGKIGRKDALGGDNNGGDDDDDDENARHDPKCSNACDSEQPLLSSSSSNNSSVLLSSSVTSSRHDLASFAAVGNLMRRSAPDSWPLSSSSSSSSSSSLLFGHSQPPIRQKHASPLSCNDMRKMTASSATAAATTATTATTIYPPQPLSLSTSSADSAWSDNVRAARVALDALGRDGILEELKHAGISKDNYFHRRHHHHHDCSCFCCCHYKWCDEIPPIPSPLPTLPATRSETKSQSTLKKKRDVNNGSDHDDDDDNYDENGYNIGVTATTSVATLLPAEIMCPICERPIVGAAVLSCCGCSICWSCIVGDDYGNNGGMEVGSSQSLLNFGREGGGRREKEKTKVRERVRNCAQDEIIPINDDNKKEEEEKYEEYVVVDGADIPPLPGDNVPDPHVSSYYPRSCLSQEATPSNGVPDRHVSRYYPNFRMSRETWTGSDALTATAEAVQEWEESKCRRLRSRCCCPSCGADVVVASSSSSSLSRTTTTRTKKPATASISPCAALDAAILKAVQDLSLSECKWNYQEKEHHVEEAIRVYQARYYERYSRHRDALLELHAHMTREKEWVEEMLLGAWFQRAEEEEEVQKNKKEKEINDEKVGKEESANRRLRMEGEGKVGGGGFAKNNGRSSSGGGGFAKGGEQSCGALFPIDLAVMVAVTAAFGYFGWRNFSLRR